MPRIFIILFLTLEVQVFSNTCEQSFSEKNLVNFLKWLYLDLDVVGEEDIENWVETGKNLDQVVQASQKINQLQKSSIIQAIHNLSISLVERKKVFDSLQDWKKVKEQQTEKKENDRDEAEIVIAPIKIGTHHPNDFVSPEFKWDESRFVITQSPRDDNHIYNTDKNIYDYNLSAKQPIGSLRNAAQRVGCMDSIIDAQVYQLGREKFLITANLINSQTRTAFEIRRESNPDQPFLYEEVNKASHFNLLILKNEGIAVLDRDVVYFDLARGESQKWLIQPKAQEYKISNAFQTKHGLGFSILNLDNTEEYPFGNYSLVIPHAEKEFVFRHPTYDKKTEDGVFKTNLHLASETKEYLITYFDGFHSNEYQIVGIALDKNTLERKFDFSIPLPLEPGGLKKIEVFSVKRKDYLVALSEHNVLVIVDIEANQVVVRKKFSNDEYVGLRLESSENSVKAYLLKWERKEEDVYQLAGPLHD